MLSGIKYRGIFWAIIIVSLFLHGFRSDCQTTTTQQPRLQSENATGIEKVRKLNELSKSVLNHDRKQAMKYAEQAQKLALSINDKGGLALAYKNIGNAFIFQAEYDSAQKYYKLALPMFQSIGDLSGVSACLNNLGVICSETGRYDEAIGYLNQSVETDKKLGDDIGASATINNIAGIYKYQGSLEKR